MLVCFSRAQDLPPELHRDGQGSNLGSRAQDPLPEQRAHHIPGHPGLLHPPHHLHVRQGQRVPQPVLAALHPAGHGPDLQEEED